MVIAPKRPRGMDSRWPLMQKAPPPHVFGGKVVFVSKLVCLFYGCVVHTQMSKIAHLSVCAKPDNESLEPSDAIMKPPPHACIVNIDRIMFYC